MWGANRSFDEDEYCYTEKLMLHSHIITEPNNLKFRVIAQWAE